VIVIGIGNTMRRDDGIGIAAVDRLATLIRPDAAHLETMDGESTRLIEAWSGAERAVVVDAMRSGEPAGSVRRIEVGRDPLPSWAPGASSHHAGLAEAVDLGRALDRLPGHLVIYGVEVHDVSPGEGLSPTVENALPDLVRRLQAEVLG
jgi:hydrogenase maturation protease